MPDEMPRGWTWGRSLVLLLLLLDLTAVAVWLAFNLDTYESLSTVVGGLWAGGMVVLGYLKVGVRKESTFPEFFGSIPARMVVAGYTVLIAGLLLFSAAAALPVHRVDVRVAELEDGTVPEVVVRLESGEETFGQPRSGGMLRFWLPVGDHFAVLRAEGYTPREEPLRVNVWDLGTEWELPALQRESGRLEVASRSPADLSYTLRSASEEGPPLSGRLQEPVPGWTLPLGRYVLSVSAEGFRPDSFVVDVPAEDTVRLAIELRRLDVPVREGRLVLRSRPEGLRVLLDGRERSARTPTELRLAPGTYELELRGWSENAPDIGFHLRRPVRVSDGEETVVDTALSAIRLPLLVISPDGGGAARYYLDRVAPETLLGEVSQTREFPVFPGRYRVLRERDGEAVPVATVEAVAGGRHVVAN